MSLKERERVVMKRKNRMEKLCALSLVLALLVPAMGGCGSRDPAAGETTLWVVTEVSPVDGMNYQAEEAVKRFREAHENVTVNLEILPTDEQEREIRLKQLRAMIPAGQGPDVYLLPVSDTMLLTTPQPYTPTRVEALFPDVTQAMYNGMFADISEYYDADDALGKEALNTTVMDVGVLDGARYVLPLRYNVPVVYTDPQLWEQWGLTREDFDAGVGALMEAALSSEDPELLSCGLMLSADLRMLPKTFDYEKGRLLLSEEALADYMALYQRWKAAVGRNPRMMTKIDIISKGSKWYNGVEGMFTWLESQAVTERYYNSMAQYISDFSTWHAKGFPLYSGTLADAMTAVYIARERGDEMTMLPLRTVDGVLAAEVTYYGAVGSGTGQPELAYEFLRTFLTEEFQWDGCRPRIAKSADTDPDKDPQRKGMVEDSWPVRTEGSVAPLWDNLQYQYLYYVESKYSPGATSRCRKVQEASLTDGDIPALDFAIDEVRFSIAQEEDAALSAALEKLNDSQGNPTDADISALAAEVHLNLWWHMAEG